MSSTMRKEIFIVILTLGLGLLVHFARYPDDITSTKISYQFLALKAPVLRRNKATNSSTSTDPSSAATKILVLVFATEYNRVLIFKEPIEGKMLPGHVIRTEKVANEGSCRVRCFLEPSCVSINVGPADDQGQRTCELNNFSDESPSQTGLQEATGHIHYSAENICHSKPCPGENFICQVGFTAKRYRCICRDGFKGENCDEEINECRLGTGCGVSENPPTVSSASKALDTSTASSSATQSADASSSEATLIPIAVSTAYPVSTTQSPQQDVSSSEPAVIPTAVSTTSRTSTNQTSQQACQQDWICNGTPCYKLVKSPRLSWEKAKEECEKCQARLVKIESREENDFIKTKLLPTKNNGSYWIGLSDSDNKGDWMWTDGTQLDRDGYKNWGDNQPDNNKKQQNCVVIQMRKSDPDHNGKWHDKRCSQERKYICENL